jgi:Holliday junction resolvase RusA-like endonuclease
MTHLLQLVIPGEPCGKQRPRFVMATGRTYTPGKTVNAETFIKELFAQAYPGFVPLKCALAVTVIAYMGIPVSAPKTQRVLMLSQKMWPTKKPDADNILKLVADALGGLAYVDDKQIVTAHFHKVYSDRPRLEINIVPKEDCLA